MIPITFSIAYITGLLLWPLIGWAGWILFLISLLGIFVYHQHPKTWLACMISLSSGLGLSGIWKPIAKPPTKPLPTCEHCVLTGVVQTEPQLTDAGCHFILEIAQLNNQKTKGRIWVYVKEKVPHYGQYLKLQGRLTQPQPAFNPGQFSYRAYFDRLGVSGQFFAKKFSVEPKNTLPPWQIKLWKTRRRVIQQFTEGMGAERGSILASLVLGTYGVAIPEETTGLFRELGLAHILAVSGFQMSLIAFSLWGLFRRLGMPRLMTGILVIMAIGLFAYITGFPPSVLRAALMCGVVILSRCFYREVGGYVSLWLTMMALLIWHPQLVMDIGFQFSILATWGILTGTSTWKRLLCFLPPLVVEVLAVTLAAQVWVLPLQIYHFSTLSLWLVPANLVSAMIVSLLTFAGMAYMGILLVVPAAQLWIFQPMVWLISVWLWGLKSMEQVADLTIYFSQMSIMALLFLYAALFSLSGGRTLRIFCLFFLCSGFLLSAMEKIVSHRLCPLQVTFLSVGQGDAAFIQAGKKNILVDAGPAFLKRGQYEGGKEILAYFKSKGIRHLDIAIITHAHLDHYGGLFTLLEHIKVDTLWLSYLKIKSEEGYQQLLRKAVSKRVQILPIYPNQTFSIAQALSIYAMAPIETKGTSSFSEINDSSLVLQLRYGKNRILLTGDIETEAETTLTQFYSDELQSQVIKVPHHGSSTSSTEEFLLHVRPQLAVISVGTRNRYHHPSQDVIRRYQEMGVQVLRTDRDGAIGLCCNGRKITARGFLKMPKMALQLLF